jgi:hypothetical protein
MYKYAESKIRPLVERDRINYMKKTKVTSKKDNKKDNK